MTESDKNLDFVKNLTNTPAKPTEFNEKEFAEVATLLKADTAFGEAAIEAAKEAAAIRAKAQAEAARILQSPTQIAIKCNPSNWLITQNKGDKTIINAVNSVNQEVFEGTREAFNRLITGGTP